MKAILQTPETRRRILELLKSNGAMTADELSEALKITAMGVRRHLATLERDGLIHYKTVPKKIGRPSYLYLLTEQGDELFPRTYAQFANSLLESLRALEGDPGLQRLFAQRTAVLEDQYRARLAQKKTLAERVAELARIRTEEGYMAYGERHENIFLLHEHNCAIRQVAQQCLAACHAELELFQRVLDDAEVTREAHIARGDRVCSYRIRRVPRRC